MLPHVDGEILDDEVVIIHSSHSVGEPEVFEPHTRVRSLGVSGDVGGWSEALWERRSLDTPAKGSWSWAIWARTSVVWLATMPRARFTAPLDGLAETRVVYPRRCPTGVIIILGVMLVVDDATSILARTRPFAY